MGEDRKFDRCDDSLRARKKSESCSRILNEDDWSISKKEIIKYEQFGEIDKYPDQFLKFYFKERLIFMQSKGEEPNYFRLFF